MGRVIAELHEKAVLTDLNREARGLLIWKLSVFVYRPAGGAGQHGSQCLWLGGKLFGQPKG